MATPPPFTMPPPSAEGARGSSGAGKTCLIAGLVIVGLCVVLMVIGGVFFRNVWGQVTATANCMATLETVRGALIAYSMENDDRLPLAADWQAKTERYYERLYKKFSSSELPKDFWPSKPGEPLVCKWEGRSTGVAFNSDLGGSKVKEIKEPQTTALVFETDTIGVSQSKKYEAKPNSTAPRVFYNERDWIVFYVEGNANPFDSDSTTSTDFKVDPRDALEPEAKAKDGAK